MGLYDEWAYTQEVTITNNTTTDLTGFQEAIDLDDTWQGWDNVNADGSDIRFSTQDGGTAIPYWIELWDFANKTARIWVRVPSIPASGSTTILMHWGKADAVSESDGSAVFEFFDDFDTADYTIIRGSSSQVGISNSMLRIDATSGYSSAGDIIVESNKQASISGDFIVEIRAYLEKPNEFVGIFAETGGQGYLCGWYGWAGEKGAIMRWDGWDNKNILQGEIPHYVAPAGSTQILRWDRANSELRLWDTDGSNVIATQTDTTYNSFSKVAIRLYKGGIWQVDWIRVRKFTEQEPTVTLGALTSKWLTGWSHRNKITIPNNTTTDLTDFQVAIDLDDTWDGWGLVKSDGSDIRVTDAGGSTLLPHWIEEFDATNKTARIWVRVPSIPANGSVDVYLYYGNPDATDASDGSAVFEFFDDFEGNSLNTDVWDVVAVTGDNGTTSTVSASDVCVQNSYVWLDCQQKNINVGIVEKVKTFTAPYIVETKARQNPDNLDDDVLALIFAYQAYNKKYQAVICFGDTGWGASTALAGDNPDANETWDEPTRTTPKDGNWHHIRVDFYSADGTTAKARYYLDGSLVSDASTTNPYYDGGKIGLSSNGLAGGAQFDWVFVRKYAEQEPTVTIAAREDLQTVYTFYKRVKLILNDDASNEDVELIIDDKFKAFWANRGVELAIVKDGDDTRLLHTINSETTDHISITAHGVTGAKGDVYWLYFDDGQERDTSNLDDTFTPAGLSKTFSIDYILPGEPYVIYDVTFSGFAGKLAESDLTNLTVVDGNTNTVVAHKVVSYEKDGSGAVTSLRLQVRAAYATDTRTFYLYLVGKGQTFDTPDTYIYPVASTGWALLWEKKSVGVSTSILLDGNSFNVTEYDVGYRRNTYHFDIEEGESYNLPSSNYSRVFRLRLVATDDELSTLHTIMKRPYILVDWLGEEFYGQIIELRYRKDARRPMVYDVELTVERVRVI